MAAPPPRHETGEQAAHFPHQEFERNAAVNIARERMILNNARLAREAFLLENMLLNRPGFVVPPGEMAARRGAFAIRISRLHVTHRTSDDRDADGPGDEVFVRCAVGYYSKSARYFGLLTNYRSPTFRGLRNGESIEDFEDPVCVADLAMGDHVILLAPTIWEDDSNPADDGSARDSEALFHEMAMALEEDIGGHVSAIASSSIGAIKRGQDFEFPFVSGVSGRNRPIGMSAAGGGKPEFYPKVLLLNLPEAVKASQPKHRKHFIYNDAADLKLGGHYELDLEVTPYR